MDGRKRPWWDYADNLLNSEKLDKSALNYTFAMVSLKYGSTPDWHKLSVMKRGNYGILAGVLSLPADSAWTEHNIFSFPSGYNPAHRIDAELVNCGNVCCRIMYSGSGSVSIRYTTNVSSQQEFWINIPFLIA